MIKKILVSVCITLTIGVIYSPISVKAQVLPESTTYALNQPEPIICNKIKFDTVSLDKAPEALTKEIDLYKGNEGFLYYVDDNSNNLYVAIMIGMKPTGGYDINVKSVEDVEDVEGRANILVEEIGPSKDAIVPQMVTYPYTIIKAQLPSFSISVKNSSGKVYNCLDLKENTPNIIGSSWILGNLKNIYTENNFIFLEIQDINTESQLFYVNNTDEWKNKIKNLKLNSTVSVQYALGTPQKYNEKSAFPLSEIKLPIDKISLTDKNWEDLKAYSNVLPNKEWTISFKQELKKENVDSSNLYVVDSAGNIIPTASSLSDDKKSIKVTPYKPYKLGEKYYLFITNNLNGNTKSSLKGFRMNFQITDSIPIK